MMGKKRREDEEVEDEEESDSMSVDENMDEALAAAQNITLLPRKIRGRASGSLRKKARIAAAADSSVIELTAEERDLRTLYITNVPFEAVEQDFIDIFKSLGKIHEIRLSRNRSTGKLCGIAHVEFCSEESALQAIVKFSDMENSEGELHGRRIHVDRADSKLAKWHFLPSTLANRVGEFRRTPSFRLPRKMEKELVRLFIEKKYEGKNISCLKCAYEKTHLGPKGKLDVAKYGFRRFSAALRTIPQLRLANQKLTIVAYLIEETKKPDEEDEATTCKTGVEEEEKISEEKMKDDAEPVEDAGKEKAKMGEEEEEKNNTRFFLEEDDI